MLHSLFGPGEQECPHQCSASSLSGSACHPRQLRTPPAKPYSPGAEGAQRGQPTKRESTPASGLLLGKRRLGLISLASQREEDGYLGGDSLARQGDQSRASHSLLLFFSTFLFSFLF